ncbi:type-F conjugative transfer system protein TraW [Acinetobacter ursingii]|uniref:type-F conjugative transfer system protein TraW n=1 Tax=Acinetobacter ursingii TaxID=108980 RepID=UPI00254C216B|nr:type-F conjugative transfer system protein TraW [Acinetobacter ursingii]MEC6128132.1 type-F conjugative transfer system protein TraW [Acinetobacter ursingii]
MLNPNYRKLILSIGICAGLCTSNTSFAKDFGTYGDTYPVVEMNFIEAIQSKLQAMIDSGEWETFKKKYVEETMEGFKRPKGTDLPHATENRTRLVDPSIILEMDIQMPDGKYIARKGDYINPLKQMGISHPLAFIDGDDPKQVEWAIKMREKNPKTFIVLVSGNWYDLSVKHKFQFWFDQTGEFIKRLDIQKTPSYVIQQDLRLKVDEFAL